MIALRRSVPTACDRIPVRERRAGQAIGWVGLFLVILVAVSVPVAHRHDHSGFYDEECPLVWLALPRPGAPVTSVPTLGPLASVRDPVAVLVVTGPASTSLTSFDPRAPPLLTLSSVLAH